jgi:hypothetical protein
MTIERIDEHDTAKRAYALWQARGRPEGSPETDWFQAERELKFELDAVAQPLAALGTRSLAPQEFKTSGPAAHETVTSLAENAEHRTTEESNHSAYVVPEVAAPRKRNRRTGSPRTA